MESVTYSKVCISFVYIWTLIHYDRAWVQYYDADMALKCFFFNPDDILSQFGESWRSPQKSRLLDLQMEHRSNMIWTTGTEENNNPQDDILTSTLYSTSEVQSTCWRFLRFFIIFTCKNCSASCNCLRTNTDSVTF